MTWRRLERLRRMQAAEVAWRAHTAARVLGSRAWALLRAPRWNRARLGAALAPTAPLDSVRVALAKDRWDEAHRELSRELAERGSRFLISPKHRTSTADRIRGVFPGAADAASARADRIVGGEHDLLGYKGLDFAGDWHYDPVHGRRAPRVFWSAVSYLDPSCGDHKIIWELNRHQHWLALGRAYWLTGRACYRDRFCAELTGWIEANPPLMGMNWASMLEVGLRALSWVWALNFFVERDVSDTQPWTVDLLLALDRQLTHVEQNLSYYFSPNTHLLGEALALYVAGRALPELAASSRREQVGRRILVAEIRQQIGADGGHSERSTHYHRYALDFYLCALAIARITQDPIAPVFEDAARRLAGAARLLADDHGHAPHLGDDDGGMLFPIADCAPDDWRDPLAIAAELLDQSELRIDGASEAAFWVLAHPRLSGSLGVPHQPGKCHRHEAHREEPAAFLASARLPDTGYCVSRSSLGEHIVIDGGPHGYRNGGHAHADALSLTLSLRGLPLLIDTGTGCYTADRLLRDRFRSTASHNTLVLDGRSQSVPSGPFRWSRTAEATLRRWRSTSGFDYFDGSHDGYAPVEHRRRVLALHGELLVVADLVVDPTNRRVSHDAALHWHIHPAWEVDIGHERATFRSGTERVDLIVPHRRLTGHIADEHTGLGWYSPAYGRIDPTTTLRVWYEGATPFWIVSVFDLNPLDPIAGVEWVPVWAEVGVISHATALKISRDRSIDYALFAEPESAERAVTWRVMEFETDARMLFCRVARTGELKQLALVDGSTVRGAGRRALLLSLGRSLPSLYMDESSIRKYSPCAASPGL